MDYLNHGKASLSNVFEATYHDVLIGEDMLSVSDSLTAIQSLSLRVTQNEIDITAIETDLSTNYYDKTASDLRYAPISHTHTTGDITDLTSYTGFDARYYTEAEITASYYTKPVTDVLLGEKSDTDHEHGCIKPCTTGFDEDDIPGNFSYEMITVSAGDAWHTGGLDAGTHVLCNAGVIDETIVEGAFQMAMGDDNDFHYRSYDASTSSWNSWQSLASNFGNVYTKQQVDSLLDDKSDIDHTHSIYCTTTYVDSGLATKASLTHNHDGIYAPLSHSHSDVHALLEHTHLTSHITNLSSYTGFDSRYYTESQADALFAGITHSHSSLSTSASSYLEINAVFGSYNAGISLVPYSSGTSWHLSIDSDGSDFYITDGAEVSLHIDDTEAELYTNRLRIHSESGTLISETEAQLILYNIANEDNACGQNDGGSGEYVNLQLVLAARQHSTAYLTQWCLGIDASNTSSDGDLHFMYNKHAGGWTKRAYMSDSTNVGSIDFTGQHRCKTHDIDVTDHVGLIAISTGEILNLDGSSEPKINESLPVIELCNTYKDKRVYGVISDKEEEKSTREYAVGTFVTVFKKEDGIDRTIVNSVGEGAIWVNDSHGDIKNGDLISADIGGFGTLQDDDIIHSYTVGKATMDAVYTDGRAFIGCVYYCG